jgi:hypothetical protein
MLDHVPDLPLHRDAEERDKVHDENWPKHRNIEDIEERANERNSR